MARDYQMLIDGEWVPGKARREVKNKYDGSVLGTVPIADAEEVDQAIQAAQAVCLRVGAHPNRNPRASQLSRLRMRNRLE